MSFLTCTSLKGNGLGVSQQNRSVQEAQQSQESHPNRTEATKTRGNQEGTEEEA